MKNLIIAGRVTKTHGINGEVVIKLNSGIMPAENMGPVFLDFDGIQVPFFIATMRLRNENELVISFEDYPSLTHVSALVGLQVYLESSSIEFSQDLSIQILIGFMVNDSAKGEIGQVTDVIEGRQNIIVIERQGAEVMIPFVDEFIHNIDYENRIILVSLPEGLLEMNS